DEAEKALNDMRSLLKSSLISVETLLRESKNALDLNIIDDLTDLKDSLVDAQTLQDMNILEQLALSAQETIQLAQNQVYRKADEYIQS
ncbi:hypothetical protein AAEI00_21450, partial [Shewanella algae]|uniref:hypothetical protein n=1 Tax=Shewanella algae TaxID=38313 RepID=UPI003195B0FD